MSDSEDLIGDFPEPPGVMSAMTYDERVEEFLRLLGAGLKVREAAAACSIAFSTLYRRRKGDAAFAKAWDDAKRVHVPQLEAEALRRSMRGSDKLLMFMLTNLAPDRYKRSSAIEITNPDGSLMGTDAERAARVEAILAAARARKSAKDLEDML